MKRILTLATFSAVLVALLAGCASSPETQVEGVSSTMEQVDGDLREAVMQVDAVETSIDGLIQPENGELAEAFEQYSDQVAEMERVGEQLGEHADAMRERGLEYFDEWRTEGETVANPQVREISAQRHAQSREAFSDISQTSVDVKRTLQTYISDLRDIETYLSHDLTPAGLDAIAPVAEQAKQDGEALKEAIAPMLSALNRARGGMGIGAID